MVYWQLSHICWHAWHIVFVLQDMFFKQTFIQMCIHVEDDQPRLNHRSTFHLHHGIHWLEYSGAIKKITVKWFLLAMCPSWFVSPHSRRSMFLFAQLDSVSSAHIKENQCVDVIITSECIHLYFLSIVTWCLLWDVIESFHT